MVELTELGAEFCDTAVELSIELAQQWRLKLGSERFEALLDDLRAIGIQP